MYLIFRLNRIYQGNVLTELRLLFFFYLLFMTYINHSIKKLNFFDQFFTLKYQSRTKKNQMSELSNFDFFGR